MKKALISALLLVLGSAILGATVFREQVAYAAQAVLPVLVTNDTRNPVPVSVQSAVQVQPAAPITGGGGGPIVRTVGTPPVTFAPVTATALAIEMSPRVDRLVLSFQGSVVGAFWGPDEGVGSDSIDLALMRPIMFDTLECKGGFMEFHVCSVSWIGAQP